LRSPGPPNNMRRRVLRIKVEPYAQHLSPQLQHRRAHAYMSYRSVTRSVPISPDQSPDRVSDAV
jgi:hypothetical protein